MPAIITRSRRTESGAALLVMMLILVVAAASVMLSRLEKGAAERHNVMDSSGALAQARQALLGFAVMSASRPGELPCPDVDNDGVADYTGSGCASRLGRFPWRTLNSGELRDGAGERLWYAVDAAFVSGATSVLNSNTPGQIMVDGNAGMAAVILAPHAVVDGQIRSGGAVNNPAAYLEGDNATAGDDSFVSTAPMPFNDQLLALEQQDLMRVVQQRVMTEMRNRLQDYYATNGYYPYAASLGDGPDYYCDQGVRGGHLPLAIGAGFVPGSGNACTGAAPWAVPLPGWFTANEWVSLVYYTVAAPCVPGTVACGGSGALLTASGLPVPDDDKQVLLLAGGPPLSGQSRPPLAAGDLLEAAENVDGDDVYEVPVLSATDNDQLRVVAP